MKTKTKFNPKCPSCQAGAGEATPIGHDAKPLAGDYSICIECGAFLKYDKDLNVTEISIIDVSNLMLVNRKAAIQLVAAQVLIRQRIKMN